jgi:hypothetical protein
LGFDVVDPSQENLADKAQEGFDLLFQKGSGAVKMMFAF